MFGPVLLLAATLAAAQKADLEWNWRAQEVINRTDASVGNTSKFTEPERAALIDLLVQRLQKPMSEAGYDADRIHEIATTTRVRFIDLGDGKPVLFTTSVGLEGGCDSLANCPFWIFRRSDDGFVSMLDTEGVSYTIQPTSTDGLSDLVIMNHVSARESSLKLYHVVDGKYVEAGCYTALWSAPTQDPSQVSDPEIVQCKSEGQETKQPAPEVKQETPEQKPEVKQESPEPQPQAPDAKQQAPNQDAAQPKPDSAEPQQESPEVKQETPEQKPEVKQESPEPQPQAPDAKQQAPNQDAAQPDSAEPKQESPEGKQGAPEQTPEEPKPDASQPKQEAPSQNAPPPQSGPPKQETPEQKPAAPDEKQDASEPKQDAPPSQPEPPKPEAPQQM